MPPGLLPEIIPLGGAAPDGQTSVVPAPRFNNNLRNMTVLRNITSASLAVYRPEPGKSTGAAALICPGGGFSCLPIAVEGEEVARRLSALGVAAFVLRYRLLPTSPDDAEFIQQMQNPDMVRVMAHIPLTVEDAGRAMRLIRERASAWAIDPARVGVIGFSAGGLPATGIAAAADPATRPDFVAMLYSPGSPNLTAEAGPLPLFMAFASDDPVLRLVSEGSLRLYTAWKDAGHPVEMHIYSKGGHGFGAARQGLPSDGWIERLGEWLSVHDFIK